MIRHPSTIDPREGSPIIEARLTRRGFVSASLAAAGAALLDSALAGCRTSRGRAGAAAAGGHQVGTVEFVGEGTALTGTPFGSELDGRLYTDLSALTREQPVIPTERFFIRTRASRLPDLHRRWSIYLGGGVDRRTISLRDLEQRSQPQGVHLMECAGNASGSHFGMLGAAEWAGVPLAKLLEPIQSRRSRRSRVLVSGFDRYVAASSSSTPGCAWILSAEEIASTGAFLAIAMNGRPLTRDHGAPVRLFVPGWYGCACVKWVDRIAFVGEDAETTSEMKEYASRTGQQGIPRFARDYEPPAIEPAAMPVRIEKWRVGRRLEYTVVGITWGGSQPIKQWEIRFGNEAPYVPVERAYERDLRSWGFWTHTWRPPAPGRYTIRLRVAAPSVTTRRLDTGFYSRTVEIADI